MIDNFIYASASKRGWMFNLDPNSTPIDYFPWFTGGWKDLVPGIYTGNKLNTPINSSCYLDF